VRLPPREPDPKYPVVGRLSEVGCLLCEPLFAEQLT
jgi:hypothetical protein